MMMKRTPKSKNPSFQVEDALHKKWAVQEEESIFESPSEMSKDYCDQITSLDSVQLYNSSKNRLHLSLAIIWTTGTERGSLGIHLLRPASQSPPCWSAIKEVRAPNCWTTALNQLTHTLQWMGFELCLPSIFLTVLQQTECELSNVTIGRESGGVRTGENLPPTKENTTCSCCSLGAV